MAAALAFICVGLTACGAGTKTWQGGDGVPGYWVTDSGNQYRGIRKNGLIDGIGSCEYANGDRYEGEWKKGLQEGTGTYYFADGSYYQGEWKDGMMYNGM